MDRSKVRQLAAEIERAVQEVAKRNNVAISYNGASFDSSSATIKLQVAEIAADGRVMTQEASDYTRFAAIHGLKAEWLGKVFTSGGQRYEVKGLKPNAHKYPVIARQINTDKLFKFTAATVRSAFENPRITV